MTFNRINGIFIGTKWHNIATNRSGRGKQFLLTG
jgi:hypothetical protein